MKGLLIGFFQVLCFLQVFGHNQLNTYPNDEINNYSSNSQIHFQSFVQNQSHLAPAHHASGSMIHSNSSIPLEEPNLIFENTEEETEDFSSDKHLCNHLYFTRIPSDQSLDYLYGKTKNNLLFCQQLSFIPVNKRHLVFQVFRI